MTYRAPLDDMSFLLAHVSPLEGLPAHAELGEIDFDMAVSLLEPAAKLAEDVLAPLNREGDVTGAKLADGNVTMPPGFAAAYRTYCEGGWNAVPFPGEWGGQGLPWLIAFPVQEMWQGAHMAFGLCPLLNQGAVEAIHHAGSKAQKAAYLPKLIEGTWTGTMNLTEPQAGSDLSAVRTRAVKAEDGDSYKITGQKIYITYGEHDMAENIIHLVLARIDGAPEGVKGISLFIVPKILEDGSRNDVRCTGIEHKIGIHASPTCTMQFGDAGGATGYLIGEENQGLKYMFVMMNNARLSVGLQGVAVAEAACQKAEAYAAERVQGYGLESREARVAIDRHPDVRRMLRTMQGLTQGGRALAYHAARCLDLGPAGDAAAAAQVEVLTPIVKSWCTDLAQEVTSLGIQVHGGMGYVEETGAAQFWRDARILPIYEGTNGIQAMDLVFRKVLRDGGAAFRQTAEALGLGDHAGLEDALQRLLSLEPEAAAGLAAPFLNACGILMGGALLRRAAEAAKTLKDGGGYGADVLEGKMAVSAFYDEHILPRAGATLATVREAGAVV